MQQQSEAPKRTVGKPRLGLNQETKFVGFKATMATKKRIESAASNLGLNNSEIIRIAVTGFLDDFDKTKE